MNVTTAACQFGRIAAVRAGVSLAATAQGRAAAAAASEAAEEQQSLDLADFILALSNRVKQFKTADSPAGTVKFHAVRCAVMFHCQP